MKKLKLQTQHVKMLGDTFTPVSLYLKLRDVYSNTLLLESSDYHTAENSYSYIGCDPIAEFKVQNGIIDIDLYHEKQSVTIQNRHDVLNQFEGFLKSFEIEENDFKFISNGLFGFTSYDAVQYFEDLEMATDKIDEFEIPVMQYQVFRFILMLDHFKNELYLFEHLPEGYNLSSGIDDFVTRMRSLNFPSYSFKGESQETSNYTDEEYLNIIQKGKDHCQRGDVFQIVLSRRFQNKFSGDEFNVYRALRSINPSPYLFYFDYGNYKIFGSSPEAQITIKDRKATIYPIAGTFRRTGNDKADSELAEKLSEDIKENSEHVMLVDLARNDLSRNGHDVTVETFKEIQFYSHVIHLVSKVTGQIKEDISTAQMVADTFPAGTLSGAPKHMAMTLIDRYENRKRGYYAGAIGILGFNGDFNHAIMIRSFLSKNNTLYYQAGAGIVAKSSAESELEEANNKLAALRTALKKAEEL